MARSKLIILSDDQLDIERCRSFASNLGMDFESRPMPQAQSLAAGAEPVSSLAKVLPFPGPQGLSKANSGSTQTWSDKKVQTMDELESHAIQNAIDEYGGNLTEAAKALGIGRATLYRKVKQYQIDPSQARKKRAA